MFSVFELLICLSFYFILYIVLNWRIIVQFLYSAMFGSIRVDCVIVYCVIQ